jgi:flagellar biosynthesis protein FlhG
VKSNTNWNPQQRVSDSNDQAAGLRRDTEAIRGHRPLRVFAFVSGKGGVGKTQMVVNTVVLVVCRGQRVLIIDADLGLANVEVALGITPKHHMGDLLMGGSSIHDVICPGPAGIHILPGGSGFSELAEMPMESRQRLLEALEPVADTYDLVLLDVGSGIGTNVRFFAGAAQEVILVVNDEPTSLTDAYAAIKVLCLEANVIDFNILVNESSEQMARTVFARLSHVSARFLPARLKYLGSVPRDLSVTRAVSRQSAFVEAFPRSVPAAALERIVVGLLSRESAPKTGGMKLLLDGLLRGSSEAGR